MHGFILLEMKKYAIEKLGTIQWLEILKSAEVGDGDYQNFREYSDEEAVKLVVATSRVTGLSTTEVLTDFGIFLGKDLLRIYRPLLRKEWGALDVLENTERTIHEAVRSRNRQATPPKLELTRTSADELLLVYRSQRKMCSLAKGIATGIAQAYGETLEIVEESCLKQGDSECRIRLKRLEPPASSV